MKTPQEEEYVFYRFASGDMVNALSCLKSIQRYKKYSTRHAFIFQAVLSYCRPFKSSNGKHGKYKLSKSFVQDDYMELHKELEKFRDKVFAHTDLNVRSPVLKRWKAGNIDMLPIQFKHLSPSIFNKRIAEINELVTKVMNRIDQHIDMLGSWLP